MIRKSVILDTNLLMLFLIGLHDINMIGKIKRISEYSVKDFSSVENIVRDSKGLIVTNSIITEVCNLLDSDNKKYDFEIFRKLAYFLKSVQDKSIEMIDNIENDAFLQFGFTDAEIFNITNNDCLILTDDSKLAHYLENKGRQVLNINYLRKHY